MTVSFVVHLVGAEEGEPPYKHFLERGAAATFAGSKSLDGDVERADVYEVAEVDARKAVETVRKGQAVIVDTRWPKLTSEEAQIAFSKAVGHALRHDPVEALKLLGLIPTTKQSDENR